MLLLFFISWNRWQLLLMNLEWSIFFPFSIIIILFNGFRQRLSILFFANQTENVGFTFMHFSFSALLDWIWWLFFLKYKWSIDWLIDYRLIFLIFSCFSFLFLMFWSFLLFFYLCFFLGNKICTARWCHRQYGRDGSLRGGCCNIYRTNECCWI